MKNIVKIVGALLVSLGLAGCFQVDQVISLSPDGSGTLEETFMISNMIAGSMSALSDGMGGQSEAAANKDKTPPPQQSMFKEEDIKKKAESYGQGVRFVKMERITNQQFEGYKAVYSFSDINSVRLDQVNPGMPGQTPQASDPPAKGTTFVFTPGKTAKLVVKQSKKELSPTGTEPDKTVSVTETDPEQLAMMRQMFNGLRVSTKLVINGKVINSNATHRNGSTIILAEIDFNKILDKPELLAKMAAIPPGDQSAAMEMMKKLPGMKIDMNEELLVSFK
jgi:hypothetical protein